ncbi:hypothetical protein, partial [Trinickia sp.]|uniref:hypothetical protein n=1 Tax=Trinickia sp. TaxID=2571163 RepID=UPI003F7CE35E
MKPSFVHGKSGAHEFNPQRGRLSKLLTFLLASIAARGLLVQSALAQYSCPSSCTGLTLGGGNIQTVNSGGLATSTTLNGGFQTSNCPQPAFRPVWLNTFGRGLHPSQRIAETPAFRPGSQLTALKGGVS